MLVQLVLAPLTLVLTTCFLVTGRLSRWRPLWLAVPAAAGLILVLSVGTGRAAAGYAALGSELVRQLAGTGFVTLRLARLPALLAAWPHWLPAQLPLALIVASAQTAAWHLAARGGTGAGPRYRPGAVVAVRRAYLTATLRRGEVATLDGGCVGIEPRTGRRAAISWQEAQRGVLCTGQISQAATATGTELAVAAIQHRKAVIVVDLTGDIGDLTGGDNAPAGGCRAGRGRILSGAVTEVIESACADVGTRLRWFSAERGGYEPFAGVRPDRGADLVAALIDWSGMTRSPAFCNDCLSAALAVIAAMPAGLGRRPAPVLDELVRLLQPGELLVRLRQLAEVAAGGDALARKAGDLAAQLEADPAVLAPVADQLRRLRSTALGARLRPPVLPGTPAAVTVRRDRRSGIAAGADAVLSLATVLVSRDVVVFALDRHAHGRPAAQVARLVVADLTGVLAQRRDLGVRDDCLVWINGCEVVSRQQLAALAALGPATGTCVVLGSTAGAVAASLADTVQVVALRGPAPDPDPDSAASAGRGPASPPGSPERLSFQEEGTSGLGAWLPRSQRADEVSVRVSGPQPRLITRCRVVR